MLGELSRDFQSLSLLMRDDRASKFENFQGKVSRFLPSARVDSSGSCCSSISETG